MSLRNVIGLLANLGDSPRFSKGRDSQIESLQNKDLRENCDSRYSHLLPRTYTGAHAHARASTETIGTGESRESGESHAAPSLNVTVLKHCRCIDCRNFSQVEGDQFCSKGIGGLKSSWETGRHICDPPPEEWHYCRDYHGPQISTDIWAWPRGQSPDESKSAVGSSGDSDSCDRSGNGSETGFFRSTAHTQGKEP